jgi:hypothetical protein
MKHFAAFALMVLSCVPAKAQMGGMGGRPAQAQNIEAEILEMEQEADKAALKEALLLQAREGMKITRGAEAEKKQIHEESAVLHDFIARKKEAVTARAAKILEQRMAGRRPPAARAAQPSQDDDKEDAVEGFEKARIEAQLLQVEVNLQESELAKAIDALATEDLAAGNDPARLEKAKAARKEYDTIRAKLVELKKRQYREQQIVLRMQMQMQNMRMGGMGGGGFQ